MLLNTPAITRVDGAPGGRHYRGGNIDQNFDSYTVEYTFADEAKLYLHGRNMPGCYSEFASHAHGTKGYALVSGPGGHRSQARIHKGMGPDSDVAWTAQGLHEHLGPYFEKLEPVSDGYSVPAM